MSDTGQLRASHHNLANLIAIIRNPRLRLYHHKVACVANRDQIQTVLFYFMHSIFPRAILARDRHKNGKQFTYVLEDGAEGLLKLLGSPRPIFKNMRERRNPS